MRAIALAALLLSACGAEEAPPTEPDGTYTVRGQIMEMGEHNLAIHHESIPDFTNREGEVSGMDSMTMMFWRPESVAVEGIEVGDPVELTFDVRWSGDHTLTISAIDELPAGTELELTADHH
ncbi:MAG: copper-binding protein [Deltaproteobacteria bacterium]|nr:copper-binding protein [Deltaproteobacteria bacterium]